MLSVTWAIPSAPVIPFWYLYFLVNIACLDLTLANRACKPLVPTEPTSYSSQIALQLRQGLS